MDSCENATREHLLGSGRWGGRIRAVVPGSCWRSGNPGRATPGPTGCIPPGRKRQNRSGRLAIPRRESSRASEACPRAAHLLRTLAPFHGKSGFSSAAIRRSSLQLLALPDLRWNHAHCRTDLSRTTPAPFSTCRSPNYGGPME